MRRKSKKNQREKSRKTHTNREKTENLPPSLQAALMGFKCRFLRLFAAFIGKKPIKRRVFGK
jgi:hypothetical protein